MRCLINAAVAGVAIIAMMATGGAQAGTGNSRTNTRMVAVSQVVSGAGPSSSMTIDAGAGAYVRGSLTLAKGARRLDDSIPGFPKLPVINFASQQKAVCSTADRPYWKPGVEDVYVPEEGGGTECHYEGLADGDVVAMLDSAIATTAPGIVAQLTELIQSTDSSTGVFTFEQDLGTTALSGRKRLVWSLFIDPAGRSIYGKAKILTASKYYLYVSYTPKVVTTGLPAAWAYPSAGMLTWTIVDSKMKALQDPVSVNTNGFFDEPDGQPGDESKLSCLMKRAGCSSSFPDVLSLLAESGADGAFVDYLHLVAPVYRTVESPAGSGEFISIAEFILQAPTRTVSTSFDPTCLIPSYTYSTSGQYQFNLNHSMTRYYMDKGKVEYAATAQMAKVVQSPWQTYGNSVSVGAGMLGSLPNYYIDPFGQEGPLVSVGYLPAGSSVGGVNYLAPPACTPVVPTPVPPVPPASPF